MKEIIIASILFAVSVFLFFMSARSFMEKGFLFNNAYIYASKQEREKMNKKPYYRQSAIVFLLFGIVFLLLALAVLLEAYWISFVGVAVVIITLIYAIVSSITIEKNNKQ
ncbi:MAG: DUF3784 domain-containing protein [Bacilli bacterium]|nr:DUF3784 domain-containing protein [Bacilli bacterium]MDD3121361.1 DUF3784 domain-containing protein [Bacilli bacterium]MDD4063617.1 DUF3784 domain-containing protein [Bacilli bacterium]